ncbi:putative epidermal cell surface receptor isoform X2 [Athalia rosae]|uniref:putative epidermal cell surface receptor isoform X2 n=1 Tax=Athalia rosae TaxID=37344 RepID=UPI002033F7B6|nr:putative epidermal cell surface receptor isoform X2 [Athalia rosae]
MYAMSTCCRRWLLLSIIGSAIIVSIVAATDDGSNDKISDPPPVAELIKPKVVPNDAKDILGDRPISSPGDTVDELSKNDKVESIEGTKNDSRVVADLEKKAHSKGRALQGSDVGVFAVPDGMSHGKPDVTKNSLHGNITDLSDVSMDYDDKDIEGGEYLAIARNVTEETGTTCSYGNQTFSPGAVIRRGCSEKCVCGKEGKIQDCQPIVCSHPFFRAGRVIEDPLCGEKLTHEEPCCALLVCSQLDSEPEPEELCYLGDQTVQRGETIQDGCSRVCVCEAQGELKCRPRCTEGSVSDSMTTMSGSRATQRDKCVRVPDPKDSCCTIVLCDVTLGDHEIKSDAYVNLTRTEAINSTAVRLTFSNNLTSDQLVTVEMSTDNLIWKEVKVGKDGVIGGLAPSSTYYIRMHGDTDGVNRLEEMRVTLPEAAKNGSVSTASTSSSMNATPSSLQNLDDAVCFHRGKSYKIDAEWYDECISFCTCSRPGVGVAPTTECATIECPTDFGLDVLDPHCLDWEMVPADFVPVAPRCCPQEVRCRNNGSCLYEGSMYNNWSEIPTNVTGCEKRCYCEMGNVSCQAACPPVPALPPANLLCPPAHAVLTHLPEDDCCLYWGCGNPANGSSLPATIGRNVTSRFPGPLASDLIDQLQSIDDNRKMTAQGSGHRYGTVPGRGAYDPERLNIDAKLKPDETDRENGQLHYPMDPGHPTTTTTTTTTTKTTTVKTTPPPYYGPYDPNYKPTEPLIENVFRLTPNEYAQKPKTEPKKSHETGKPVGPTKDTVLANADVLRFDSMPITEKKPSANSSSHYATEPAFTPAIPFYRYNHSFANPDEDRKAFAPQNGGENVAAVPHFRYHTEYDQIHRVVGPTGQLIEDQNTIAPVDRKKVNINPQAPNKPSDQAYAFGGSIRPPQVIGGQENNHGIPDELYHLINLQHPGLIRLEEDTQGIYDHGEIVDQGSSHLPPEYHDHRLHPGGVAGSKNYGDQPSNGYLQIHRDSAAELPLGVHQQIQDLLMHVGNKDPNPGPFIRYPPHQETTNRPNRVIVPQLVLPHNPQTQPTRLNHPFPGDMTTNPTFHDLHTLTAGLDHGLPLGFPIHGGHGVQSSSDQVTVRILEAIADDRVRLVFTVPRVLVGLHGRVQVRYTSDRNKNSDPSTWKSQVFAPPDDLIATPQLEFELGGLRPSTVYRVMVTVKLRDLANSPSSEIREVTTFEASEPEVTLPPQVPTDAELVVTETNSTWANVMWKKFTEYELQFIDGVQLRYKEIEGKVYAATPLIHRAVTSYVIENLKPDVTYEVGIYFIPFPGQPTELVSERTLNFTTSSEPDPYSFAIKVEIKGIKATEVEVAWKGVPYPEDKYVNIYRAIYQSDTGKEDTSTFKIAKRDSPDRTIIGDLKPGTRYRLWIEVYLTNGRIKKSNVQDFVTKPGVPTSAGVVQGKSDNQVPQHEGDYYGPLVIVAIVASLAILSTLILLMLLMKRRTSSKADISPRKTTSAYDNPSYKVEIQQETMDL